MITEWFQVKSGLAWYQGFTAVPDRPTRSEPKAGYALLVDMDTLDPHLRPLYYMGTYQTSGTEQYSVPRTWRLG